MLLSPRLIELLQFYFANQANKLASLELEEPVSSPGKTLLSRFLCINNLPLFLENSVALSFYRSLHFCPPAAFSNNAVSTTNSSSQYKVADKYIARVRPGFIKSRDFRPTSSYGLFQPMGMPPDRPIHKFGAKLNNKKFADLLILRLLNCEKASRVYDVLPHRLVVHTSIVDFYFFSKTRIDRY